ncbi:putative MarR family transcriptional regulator [Actinacidiphila reveromycinica]|uniref:Putative MarR family transcriptional regulator n=1 Tax=Actinacidiphila reveromycinica TaxID=659352 RepID=A0A7U3UR95_9ACTN|nr:MarR family winged helix-turn-helix transcriptional regulator [Streptomyces sp. SN-593]BBA97233.1 putative MarR family transcriptional regulator [Streptomyces sp. SN-593]
MPRLPRDPARDPTPEQLAATLRSTVGTLVRATRSSDRLAAIPATVLDLLDRRGPMTTADLAAGRGVRHQTMAATVRELTDAGYLAAGPHPADARKKILTLTPAGARALAADRRHRVGALAQALATSLDGDERRALARALHLLDRVAAALTPDGSTPDGSTSDGRAPTERPRHPRPKATRPRIAAP